jgi:hypothetical protein
VKRSDAKRVLGAALVAYILFDVLLTPPAHLETRNPAFVTGIGIAALVLLFIGLALAIVALVLLFRGSRRSPMLAIIAGVLYLPGPLTEFTGRFSSLRAPTAIAVLEVVEAIVAVSMIGIGVWLLRSAAPEAGS